jgi:hypothetical protein
MGSPGVRSTEGNSGGQCGGDKYWRRGDDFIMRDMSNMALEKGRIIENTIILAPLYRELMKVTSL